MKGLLTSAFILLAFSLVNSQVLQPCRVTAPDQITQLLPNYTGTVQPCSYSGFAPLDSEANNALFYWYFPNQLNDPNAPVVLWLQGGPGASSMFGALVEKLSPFTVVPNTGGGSSVIYNDQYGGHSWAYYYNVLFFDNPVGTGFSYTANNAYPTNMDEVSDNLWTALQYFVSVHPETLTANWYFTGESHAGRYIPAFAYYTLKYNAEIVAGTRQQIQIPLKSILVGDGYVHGVQQRITEIGVGRAATMLAPYQVSQVKAIAVNCQNLAAIEGTTSIPAVNTCNQIPDYLGDVSGIDAYAIQISANETALIGVQEDAYLNDPAVYKVLHVTGSKKKGPLFTDNDQGSANALLPDVLNNSIIFIDSVLSQIPCMFFAGNFDARDGSYGTYDWLELLGQPWPNILNQTRNIWYLNGNPVGFWLEYENLTFITLDNAGHFTPYFQIDVTRTMVETFITGGNWDPYRNTTNVSSSMCTFMNNCNGNGQCGSNGMCNCNPGYFLEDCSVQPQAFNPSSNSFTLAPRGLVYLKFDLSKGDQSISLQGQNASTLAVYYAYDRVSTYNGDAAGVLSADPHSGTQRNVYLSSGSGAFNTVYVTIQNSDFLDSVSFTVSLNQAAISDATDESLTTSSGIKDLAAPLTAFFSGLIVLAGTALLVLAKAR